MIRTYRNSMKSDDLSYFSLKINESDLYIGARNDVRKTSFLFLKKIRKQLEYYIQKHPDFLSSLRPIQNSDKSAPEIIRLMQESTLHNNVGPMASVAGAINEMLYNGIKNYSSDIIIENGGDIILRTTQKRIIALYTGENRLKNKLHIEIQPDPQSIGICTSSGKFGHSLSFGNADAVTILARNSAYADATATAVCNMVNSPADIDKALKYAITRPLVTGAIIVSENKLGIIGDVKFI